MNDDNPCQVPASSDEPDASDTTAGPKHSPPVALPLEAAVSFPAVQTAATRRRSKFSPVNVILGVVLVLIVATEGTLHYNALRRLADQQEASRQSAQIEKWISDLRVPDSALYCDRESQRAIAEVRNEMYAQLGADGLGDYGLVYAFDGDVAALGSSDRTSAQSPEALIDRSFDVWSRQQAAQSCLALAQFLETGNIPILNNRRQTFDRSIRPLLIRLLTGIAPDTDWLQVCACRALLAGNDRSPETLAALERLLAAPRPSAVPLVATNGTDFKARSEAVRLNVKYRLELQEDATTVPASEGFTP